MPGIIYDTHNYDDYSVGIVSMEGHVGYGLPPLKPTYDALRADAEKNDQGSSLKEFSSHWDTDMQLRSAFYESENDRTTHQGAMKYGHTAIMTRMSGQLWSILGFVPTTIDIDKWPCPGKWVDNMPMRFDPHAACYEVNVTENDVGVLDDKLNELSQQAEGRQYSFNVEKMSVNDKNQGSYNCIAAALSVLKDTLPFYNSHWDFLIQKCTEVRYSQSAVKNGIITGWMDVNA